jgi:hypothetical protein
MFLRVVETIVTKEVVSSVDEELNYDKSEGLGLSDLKQEELFDVHGESLRRESD